MRRERFKELFRAHDILYEWVDTIAVEHEATIRDEAVSRVVGASLAKSLKTFQAIEVLCLFGHGEDGLILLRSNINLLINLGYILTDREPNERCRDLIAYSQNERAKYLKRARGAGATEAQQESDPDRSVRAARWDATKISERAKRVPEFHYQTGYKLYSSFEHSDAMALDGYIEEQDAGPRVDPGSTDAHVEVALSHSLIVLADILTPRLHKNPWVT
jgi:hypothetical protein